MATVDIEPELIRWAIARSQKGENIEVAFPKLKYWLTGEVKPTLKQLEKFAKSTSTPLGYFFLKNPPEENLTVPHYRTLGNEDPPNASPELIDTLHTMQRRQEFICDFFEKNGWGEIDFVGSYKGDNPKELAELIRRKLDLKSNWAKSLRTWHDALKFIINKLEEERILVMVNGVVANNTHRKLDVEEFRGFVLVNKISPLIFINGSDSKSAQIFTLIHEVVHVWIGQSAIVEASPANSELSDLETFCNKTAAEVLCPSKEFNDLWMKYEKSPFDKIAFDFKVSPIVVARRALELGIIDENSFWTFYKEYQGQPIKKSLGGGDFYKSTGVKLGRLFTNAVISQVKAGDLMYRDAYRLTDLKRDTFNKYVDQFTKGSK